MLYSSSAVADTKRAVFTVFVALVIYIYCANAFILLVNTKTILNTLIPIVSIKIAIISLKTLFPVGIRTRVI
jgi:hypothetical protein